MHRANQQEQERGLDLIGFDGFVGIGVGDSGRQRTFSNRMQWAKKYLTEAGLLETTRRAHFKITERGKRALAEQPNRIDNAYLSRFEEFNEFRQSTKGGNS